MKRVALAALAALSLSACATQYEANAFDRMLGRGVEAKRLDETTLYIKAAANSRTSTEQLIAYMVRKAAEETQAAGYEWFTMEGWSDHSKSGVATTPVLSNTNAYVTATGNTAYGSANTFTSGGNAYAYFEPGAGVFVKMGRGPKPEGQTVFVASEALVKTSAFLN